MSNERPAILLLSAAAELKESVVAILNKDYNIVDVNTADAAKIKLQESGISVCVTDLAAATRDIGDTFSELKKSRKNLKIILICPREQREKLFETNLSGKAFRVLFSPLSPGQTKLALAAAFKSIKASDEKQSKNVSARTRAIPPQKTASQAKTQPQSSTEHRPKTEPRSRPVPSPQKQIPAPIKIKLKATHKPSAIKTVAKKSTGSRLIPIIASVAALSIAGVGWLLIQGGSNNSVNPDQARDTSNSLAVAQQANENLEQLLENANAALINNNYFPPDSNNALTLFLQALEIDNINQAAQAGLKALSQEVLADFDLHLANGNINEAKSSLSKVRSYATDSQVFANILETTIRLKKNAQINNIRQALAEQRIEESRSMMNTLSRVFLNDNDLVELQAAVENRTAAHERVTEIKSLIENANFAFTKNQLTEPAQKNVHYFLNQLEAIDPENATLVQLKERLGNAVLSAARSATRDLNFSAAQSFLDAAVSMNIDNEQVKAEAERLTEARLSLQIQQEADAVARAEEERLAEELQLAEQEQQEELARQAEADRIEETQRKAEADRLAEIKRLATPVEVALSDLSAIDRTAPTYPRRYEQRGVAGHAIIEFSVTKDGTTANISVNSVEPETAALFGDAGIKAVEQWIFEPYKDADGNVRIAKSQIKINFQ